MNGSGVLIDQLAAIWGTQVARAADGLLRYNPRPTAVIELLVGATRWSDRTFLVHGDSRTDYARFLEAVPSGAAVLADQGVGPGDRVMLLSYNCAEFVLAIWSIWWRGAVPVLANRWWTAQQVEHAVSLTKPALVIHDQDGLDIQTEAPFCQIADLTPALERGGEGPASIPLGAEQTEALVLFTSGSSGPPKGVSLNQAAVIANQHNLLARSRQLPQTLDAEVPQSVLLTTTPMFHIGGFSTLLSQFLVGGRLVISHGRFDAGQVLELIEREGVHRWGGVPTMAARMIAHPDFEGRDLSSLRSFPLGGAPVSDGLLTRLRTKLPQLRTRGLANTWGMTETGGFVTVGGADDIKQRPGTVGCPFEVGELRIAEEDGHGQGEILVRAPTVMTGYVGDSADDTVDAQGWLHTGDLGHLDDDGYLFIDGRKKDIIIRGGENIAAAHVEKAIVLHPDVIEVAVVGLPHDDLGEELAAFVRRRSGSDLDVDGLVGFLGDRLAHFEIPSAWRFSETRLPTLAVEKVDKTAIVASFSQD